MAISLPTGPTGITQPVNDNSTKLATTAFVVGQVATATPIMDSTGTVGTSLLYARQDHVHPSDTTKANLAGPTFTGVPAAPTASVATNTTQLATCAFVLANASDIRSPVADTGYTVPDALNRLVVFTSLTAARVVTLPTASGRGGQRITMVDESGSCSPTKTISIARAGSDTIDGGTSSVVLTSSYSALTLESDGTSKWVTVNYEEMTYPVADAAYAITTVRDIIINYTSISASRALTLPAATTTGQRITVIDTSGSVSGTNTIVCTRAGTDTINGGTTFTITIPYGYAELVCDGNGHWNASMGSPVFGTSATTFLRNDGTWQTPAGGGASFWTVLNATTDFATTAPSTNTITMNSDQTANIKIGARIKMTFNGATQYGQVTALTTILLTFRGQPITTGAGLLTALSWGDQSRAGQISFSIPGYYESVSTATAINDRILLPTGYLWDDEPVYFIGLDIQNGTADSGATQGIVNLVVNGNLLDTSNSTNGLSISGTSLVRSVVDINATIANTLLSRGQYLEIKVTTGTNGNALNLLVTALYVIP